VQVPVHLHQPHRREHRKQRLHVKVRVRLPSGDDHAPLPEWIARRPRETSTPERIPYVRSRPPDTKKTHTLPTMRHVPTPPTQHKTAVQPGQLHQNLTPRTPRTQHKTGMRPGRPHQSVHQQQRGLQVKVRQMPQKRRPDGKGFTESPTPH
jgi:hypothetical protein